VTCELEINRGMELTPAAIVYVLKDLRWRGELDVVVKCR